MLISMKLVHAEYGKIGISQNDMARENVTQVAEFAPKKRIVRSF